MFLKVIRDYSEKLPNFLKTVWEQSHKGSNPFPSAINQQKALDYSDTRQNQVLFTLLEPLLLFAVQSQHGQDNGDNREDLGDGAADGMVNEIVD